MTILWNFDPAYTCNRWRHFIRVPIPGDALGRQTSYELCAYEDGRWYVNHSGTTVASGTSLSLKHAKQIAVLVYEFTLNPDKREP